ncbi:MAG: DUF4124 domain-containing protein [Sulfuricella denitrificans]|nr:DUF4124 domain-containing protein [Sulfuricella denitrificans]
MLFIKSKIKLLQGAAVAFAFLASTNAQSEIYKHVDPQGRVTYSNVPMKGAIRLNLDPLTTVPAPRRSVSTPSPAGFPRIDNDTQKKRDDTRRKILEEELSAEEQLLAEAAKGKSRDEIELHEKNIAALKKELANLK